MALIFYINKGNEILCSCCCLRDVFLNLFNFSLLLRVLLISVKGIFHYYEEYLS